MMQTDRSGTRLCCWITWLDENGEPWPDWLMEQLFPPGHHSTRVPRCEECDQKARARSRGRPRWWNRG